MEITTFLKIIVINGGFYVLYVYNTDPKYLQQIWFLLFVHWKNLRSPDLLIFHRVFEI